MKNFKNKIFCKNQNWFNRKRIGEKKLKWRGENSIYFFTGETLNVSRGDSRSRNVSRLPAKKRRRKSSMLSMRGEEIFLKNRGKIFKNTKIKKNWIWKGKIFSKSCDWKIVIWLKFKIPNLREAISKKRREKKIHLVIQCNSMIYSKKGNHSLGSL